MDFIPFEKVSLQEAKAVLDGKPAAPEPERKWTHVRDAATITDMTPQAWQWFEALPQEVRPKGLAQRFPRIANTLAEIWKRPAQCEKYLDTLVLDQRGGRKGFPPDVAKELAMLKIHFNQQIPAQPVPPWGGQNKV